MILLQFQNILFNSKLCITEKRTGSATSKFQSFNGFVDNTLNEFPLSNSNGDDCQSTIDVLKNLISCKSLYISIGFMFFYQFAGYNVVTNYAGSILQRDEEAIFNITHHSTNNNDSESKESG